MRLSIYSMAHPCTQCKRYHRIFAELSAKTFVCLACARKHKRESRTPRCKPWNNRRLPRAERQLLFDENWTRVKEMRRQESEARASGKTN